MKRRFFQLFAAVLAVGMGVAVLTGPASAAQQVPLQATYTGSIHITNVDGSGHPTAAAYNGTGTAVHLGLSQLQGLIAVVGQPACGGFTAQHHDVLTAANGDQLTLTIQEDACPTGPGSFQCNGTYAVTGGTGRFAGATGSGTFTGQVSFNPDGSGSFQLTYAGSVSY